MQKHAANSTSKRILALAVIATLVTAVTTITSAAPAAAATLSVGSGEGSIMYSAHRIPSEHWGPTFVGAGANMWFVVYDSEGNLLGGEFADETGTTITGLEIGSTYYVSPTDCFSCHESDHDVVFDHWDNGSPERQRAFTISSIDHVSSGAYYRFVPHDGSSGGGNDNNGGNTGGNDNNGGNTGGNNGGSSSYLGSFETGFVDPVFYFKMVHFINNEFNSATIIAENGTSILASQIPDTNLSGQPLDSDPSLTYAEYNSLYEVIRTDPAPAVQTIRAATDAGIPWEELSDMQKAYIILKVRGTSLDASNLGL